MVLDVLLPGGGGGKTKEKFNSTSIQRVYNESVVKMAQNCDTRVGNTVTFNIEGDNNVISNIWISQDVNWGVQCVAQFFNDREFYNELTSGMEDLAKTAQKSLSIFSWLPEIPLPNITTNVTVNTNQVQETTTRLYFEAGQDCSVEAQNGVTFDVDGDFNFVGLDPNDPESRINIDQMIDGMTDCYFDVTNQEKVVNDLETIVRGNTDLGLGIFGWIIVVVIIIVVLIILLVIVVAIVRAVRGGGDKKKGQMEGYAGMEGNPYAGMEGQVGGYQGEGNPYGGEGQMGGYPGGGYGEGQMGGYPGEGNPYGGEGQMDYGQVGGGGGGGYPPAGY